MLISMAEEEWISFRNSNSERSAFQIGKICIVSIILKNKNVIKPLAIDIVAHVSRYLACRVHM